MVPLNMNFSGGSDVYFFEATWCFSVEFKIVSITDFHYAQLCLLLTHHALPEQLGWQILSGAQRQIKNKRVTYPFIDEMIGQLHAKFLKRRNSHS
jgi:hypothetical protein